MPDRAEFTAFVVAHRGGLMRAAVLLTVGDESAAEDLVQTTLTKLYVRWSAVGAMETPLGYARRTLTNAFIDQTRQGWMRRERTTDAELPLPPAPAPDLATRAAVLSALAQLPPRQRAVIVLRHWLDQDVETTARMLGCSAGTVKLQTSKALKTLKVSLSAVSDDLWARSER
ncbi:SigE family RNA polymerase sigma factor [Allobranchiibius sp. GilTou73]|uniref:SigE family RNA polymerase sigma factor n=1 Tax=Allobranchiibius sp. GilTou73 TaxID=2904523 RepID=UPI0021026F01|nr:SigE family RNA polymerase sigma factor [Allobranchiibius sp. GilTou73]